MAVTQAQCHSTLPRARGSVRHTYYPAQPWLARPCPHCAGYRLSAVSGLCGLAWPQPVAGPRPTYLVACLLTFSGWGKYLGLGLVVCPARLCPCRARLVRCCGSRWPWLLRSAGLMPGDYPVGRCRAKYGPDISGCPPNALWLLVLLHCRSVRYPACRSLALVWVALVLRGPWLVNPLPCCWPGYRLRPLWA